MSKTNSRNLILKLFIDFETTWSTSITISKISGSSEPNSLVQYFNARHGSVFSSTVCLCR